LAQSNLEFFFGANTSKYQDVIAQEVLSVNTFKIKGGETIKLIGLRSLDGSKVRRKIRRDERGLVVKEKVTPEIKIEEESFQFVQNLLEGQHVRLEFDVNKMSENNQTLAYAFLIKEDVFINVEILRQGYAQLQIRPPNTKYAEELRKAYREARQEMRGIQGE